MSRRSSNTRLQDTASRTTRTTLNLLLASVTLTGCHVGDFSASIDSDSRLPQFELSAIPNQSEPPVQYIETAVPGDRSNDQTKPQTPTAESPAIPGPALSSTKKRSRQDLSSKSIAEPVN